MGYETSPTSIKKEVALINIKTGNRWSEPVKVYVYASITKPEPRQLVDSEPFTHLKNVTITI